MPVIKPEGLKGLTFQDLDSQAQFNYIEALGDELSGYRRFADKKKHAEIIYNNRKFKSVFGEDEFNKYNNGTKEAYDFRNNMLKDKMVDDAFKSAYSPFDAKGKRNNNKGLGKDWETYYNDMSTDAKLELLNSDWKTPEQMKEEEGDVTGVGFLDKAIDFVAGEAINQYRKTANQKILDRIYSNEADNAGKNLSSQISDAYLNPEITGISESDTKQKFQRAITPSATNMGIAEYASRYGNGENGEVSSEMEDFSIEDMRQVLAKKAVYDTYLSPQMASTALNNEAKRYIKAHQGDLKRFGLWAKDTGISAMSYTADKINSLYNLALSAEDWMSEQGLIGDKPTVFVDDQGNILDPNKQKVTAYRDGTFSYTDAEGNRHAVHREQVDRTALHNMGREMDGSESESGIFHLNPLYWTRAEQFGTLDEEEQKKYEKLGSSPYKVAYDPNEDSDLTYEAFKMMSFGLADGVSMFIPFGVGTAGKVLSAANKAGKVFNGLGKAMQYTGEALSYQSKLGRTAQGLVGAGGIAYAYQRGAFQETLAQNLANADEAVLNKTKRDIYDAYNSDAKYKAQIDALVDRRAATMKGEYMAELGEEGRKGIIDEESINRTIRARAQEQVLGELVQQGVQDFKASPEFGKMQQEAIEQASDAAVTAFFPEAIKYGIVNTLGYRKWMYSNPSGIAKKVSPMFEGLKEVTTAEGRKRLAAEMPKLSTIGQKSKQLGKIAAGQFWGGAWTNGTDDMMVDAAERISADAYSKYLHDYATGESTADLYGFTDGLYSYYKGLQNSLGQETTWDAALVGGFGSLVSATPNFANIAHLATKEGRESYKNNFLQRNQYEEADENGYRRIKKDENGNPVTEKIDWRENLGDRLSYFIQNGVLNTYYGKKQTARDAQNHADYVNSFLDDNDDFNVLNDLMASDIAVDNAVGTEQTKTARFIKAINTAIALQQLGKNEKDPLSLSSVVESRRDLVDRVISMAEEGNEEAVTDEEKKSLLENYYSQHSNVPASEENNVVAMQNIIKNAQELKAATEAYSKAAEDLLKKESSVGRNYSSTVKNRMIINAALDTHWNNRVQSMKEEIGDTSTATETTGQDLLLSFGTRKTAEAVSATYELQQNELNERIALQSGEVHKALDAYNKAQQSLREATSSDEVYKAEQDVAKKKAEYENAVQERMFLEESLERTKSKKEAIDAALKEENAKKILTADEIMSLDPITRARMIRSKENYNKKQQAQINKLEETLQRKDPDALQKIQDIAVLTNRIAQNNDAYRRMAENPDAADVQLEKQKKVAADKAYDLINKRNAETLVNAIKDITDNLKGRRDVTETYLKDFTFKMLRKYSPTLLDIIEKNDLLPDNAEQLKQAKDWGKVLSDIDAVISNTDKGEEWETNIRRNIDGVIDSATDKEGIIAALEKVVDDTDGTPAAKDFEEILSGLEQLGYKRDNTVTETRKQRREREAAQRKAEEEAKKKLEEERKAAVEKATKEAERKKKEKEEEDELKKKQESQSKEAEGAEEIKPNAEFTEGEKGTLDLGEEQQNQENPVINNMGQVVEDGQGNVMAVSPTLEEQSMEDKSGEEMTVSSEETLEDPEATNTNVGDSNETRDNTFSGNAMNAYHIVPNEQQGIAEEDSLKYGGKLTRKKGEDNPKSDYVTLPDGTKLDKRNRFNRWMEQTMSINLENIVSRELSQIIAANPDLKFKFLTVRGRNLKTETDELDDNAMRSHLLLVVDYDNNVNKGIESIHSDENGGVLESNGKKYLVVGVVGYGNGQNRVRQELYDNLYSNLKAKENDAVLRQESQQFFKENPKERFYVSPNFTTEMVPMSLTPGWIVKRLENDENTANRKVSELLFDADGNPNKERNPEGLTWKDLSWGIQKGTGFLPINGRKYSKWAVMKPQKDIENLGNTFLLIPAGNGKLVPSYIIPTNYTDLQDGALKNRITDIIMKMTAPVAEGQQAYIERLNALRELSRIFHFSKDGNNILLSKDGSTLTFVKGADGSNSVLQAGTIRFTDSDARDRFFELFNTLNPRVNITADVLMDTDKLKEYDEAGALRTDAALLHTAGSGYSVWAVDRNGVMLKPASVDNPAWREVNDRNTNKKNVFYSGERYLYNRDNGTFYDASGNVITDENLIEELNYNRQIADGELTSDYTRGEWNYYLLEEGEHPKAIKVHSSTKKITKATEEEARNLAERIKTQKEDEARKQAAEARKDLAQTLPEVDLGIDAQTGDVMAQDVWKKEQLGEEKNPEEKVQKPSDTTALETAYKATSPTQNFETMAKRRELMGANEAFGLDNRGIMGLISDAFADSPIKFNDKGKITKSAKASEISEFLKGKNIEIEAIGTSEDDMKVWIETLKCRIV